MTPLPRLLIAVIVTLLLTSVPLVAAPTAAPTDAPATAHNSTSAEPKEKLQEILARPLFQRWQLRQMRAQPKQTETKLVDGMVEELQRRIREFIDWLGQNLKTLMPQSAPNLPSVTWLDKLMSMAETLKVVGYVVLAAALVVTAIWLYRAWRAMDRSPRSSKVLSREQVRVALDSGQALAMDSQSWLVQAEQLASESDLRSVYRAIYLALLSGLHAQGKIDFRQTRTNWVYVSHYRGVIEERELFSSLTGLFDQVWYGHRPADAMRLGEVRASVLQLVGDAGRVQAGGAVSSNSGASAKAGA
jgi:hypothetical protein